MLRVELFVPITYSLAAVFYALLGLYAWRRRPAVAVVPFAWVMVSMSIWSFTYALEVFLPTLPAKLFAVNLEYIGISSAPVFLFHYALDYTGRGHLITPRTRALIWLIPIITLLLTWTNPLHHHMWDMERIIRIGGLGLLSVRFGTAFWVSIAFAYGLFTLAGSMLVMDFVQRPGLYRLHISFVILALLFSFTGTVLFVFGISPIPGLDLTSLFFLPTGIGLAWVTLQYRVAEVLTFEYLTVLKNLKESVIVLNDERRILYVNPVAEQTIGKTENQAIGRPFEQAAKPFHRALEHSLDGNERRMEIQVQAGKETRTFEAGIGFMSTPNRAAKNIVVTLRDITHQKEREEELSRHGSIMSSISMAAEQFLTSSNWEENIPLVLKNLGQAAGVCRVLFFMFSRDGDNNEHTNLKYEWTAPGIQPRLDDPGFQRIPLDGHGFDRWLGLLLRDRPIDGPKLEPPVREAEFLRTLDKLCFAAVPVVVEGRRWAIMLYDPGRGDRHWMNMELDAFYAAANIFGAAETRARTAMKLARRQQSMGLLQDIVTAALKATDMKEMSGIVANRLAELIRADGCFLTLWDDARQRTIPFAAYSSLPQNYSETRIESNDLTFTQSVLQLGQTLIVEDTANTPYASPSVTRMFPTKSLIAIPLIGTDKKLGAVLVTFDSPHKFDDEEVQICEQAASLIALALEKFQAMEEARYRADTSETLRKAGIAIVEKLEMDQTVTLILEQLNRVIPYDSASIQLLDEEGCQLKIIGGKGFPMLKEVLEMRFPIPGDNPNTIVIQTGKPHIIGDAPLKYPAFQDKQNAHIHSWLGVPLIAQNKIIGLLAIDSKERDRYTDQDAELAATFASQVAIVLENARIHQEAQTQAVTDALTGVYNRRGLFQLGEFEFQRSRRINRPISALMFDIDHFKQINDRHGHSTGDQVLNQLARRCLKNSRTTDLVGRYGGEEFVVLLAETNLEAARIIGERLRLSIMNSPFETDAGTIALTISIGVAEANFADTLESLIERADAGLYQAKGSGRNRVVAME